MRRHTTVLIVLTALAVAAGLPAAARAASGDRAIALANETPVREYRGFVLFSRWDGGAYHLSVLHAGAVTDLPVRPQSTPFDADVGPDSKGAPSAVFSLCDDSCDLYVVGFDPEDAVHGPSREPGGQGVHRPGEGLGVGQQRGDVLEHHAGLREVGDVPDVVGQAADLACGVQRRHQRFLPFLRGRGGWLAE